MLHIGCYAINTYTLYLLAKKSPLLLSTSAATRWTHPPSGRTAALAPAPRTLESPRRKYHATTARQMGRGSRMQKTNGL